MHDNLLDQINVETHTKKKKNKQTNKYKCPKEKRRRKRGNKIPHRREVATNSLQTSPDISVDTNRAFHQQVLQISDRVEEEKEEVDEEEEEEEDVEEKKTDDNKSNECDPNPIPMLV
jgi:hypothetical protein